MKSKKLLHILLSVAGVAAIAVVAILAVTSLSSKPKKDTAQPSIHSLSGNEAVSMGLSNMFKDVSGLSEATDSKIETDILLTINQLNGPTDLSGLEMLLNIKSDGVNDKYALSASATYNSIEIFNGDIFADSTEMIGYIPSLYAGTIVVPYEFLDRFEAMNNTLDTDEPDTDQIDPGFTYPSTLDLGNTDLEGIEFDYEAFAEELMASMEEAIDATVANMTVENLDLQPLSSGSYYCYKASISVEDLAAIVKAGLMFSLNNEDLQAYVDAIYSASNSDIESDDASDDLIYDYDIDMSTQMSSYAMILDSYWPIVVTELETILGSHIEFTVYLTDDVELVGYELSAPNLFTFSGDFSSTTDDSDSTVYFDFICYDQDTTLIDMSLSISAKELIGDIEKPATEPILNLDELSDDELATLMNSLSLYINLMGPGQAQVMPY